MIDVVAILGSTLRLYTVNATLFIKVNMKSTYTILPQVLGHPLLMKGLTTLVISMSTNLDV